MAKLDISDQRNAAALQVLSDADKSANDLGIKIADSIPKTNENDLDTSTHEIVNAKGIDIDDNYEGWLHKDEGELEEAKKKLCKKYLDKFKDLGDAPFLFLEYLLERFEEITLKSIEMAEERDYKFKNEWLPKIKTVLEEEAGNRFISKVQVLRVIANGAIGSIFMGSVDWTQNPTGSDWKSKTTNWFDPPAGSNMDREDWGREILKKMDKRIEQRYHKGLEKDGLLDSEGHLKSESKMTAGQKKALSLWRQRVMVRAVVEYMEFFETLHQNDDMATWIYGKVYSQLPKVVQEAIPGKGAGIFPKKEGAVYSKLEDYPMTLRNAFEAERRAEHARWIKGEDVPDPYGGARELKAKEAAAAGDTFNQNPMVRLNAFRSRSGNSV